MLDKRDMTPMKWYLLELGVLLGVSTALTGCDLLQGLPKKLPPFSSIFCDVSQCYGNLGGVLLFRVDARGQFHVLHHLTSSEGRDTVSLLSDKTGDLYGVNEEGSYHLKGKSRGGFLWGGVLFAYRASDGSYHRLHVFKGSDGNTPVSLLEPSKNLLVGCTLQGGVSNQGVLFRLDASTKRYRILHEFRGKEGANPVQLLCVGSTLYGCCEAGGPFDKGVVFACSLFGKGYHILHAFNGKDGTSPFYLLQPKEGRLIGLTSEGGPAGAGVVFALDLGSNTYKILHAFRWEDGAYPTSLAVLGDGHLYGSTAEGGTFSSGYAGGDGAVFELSPPFYTYRVLHVFHFMSEGSSPKLFSRGLRTTPERAVYGLCEATSKGEVKAFRVSPDGVKILPAFSLSLSPSEDVLVSDRAFAWTETGHLYVALDIYAYGGSTRWQRSVLAEYLPSGRWRVVYTLRSKGG
jgi:uncharacterized repeat protein (TIGR03803 family)